MTTTLFTNAHIATGEPGSTAASTLPLQDILVTDGVFTAFGPGLRVVIWRPLRWSIWAANLSAHRSAIRICTLITYSRPASPVR